MFVRYKFAEFSPDVIQFSMGFGQKFLPCIVHLYHITGPNSVPTDYCGSCSRKQILSLDWIEVVAKVD